MSSSEPSPSGLPSRPTERWVTDTAAAIAHRDTQFAIELAGALLRTAAAGEGVAAERARDLLAHLPRKRLGLVSEYAVRHDRLVDLYRGVYRSRIDWLFEGERFALAVEVKTRAATGFQPFQLSNYQQALRERKAPHSGLLALTTVKPFNDQLLRPRRRFVLGYVLWRDAANRLRAINPQGESDAAVWQHILRSVLT
jgi:hypothetical protein